MLNEQVAWRRLGGQTCSPRARGRLVIGLERSTPSGSYLLIIFVTLENKKFSPSAMKSELLVVKEQNKDLIRLKNPAEWFVYRKSFFRWSVVADVICASGLVAN